MESFAEARPLSPSGRNFSLRRTAGHGGRVVLGLVFLTAGLLKAVDPAEFAHQMAGYGLVGAGVSAVAAPALIVFEILLGVALLVGARPVATAIVSVALLLFFIGLEAYGIAHGRTESCGCFGAYVQRTPAQVIGEDLLFAGLALLSIWGLKDWKVARPRLGITVLIGAGVLAAAFVVASPSLPLDDYVTRLRVGASLADLDLVARVPGLETGRHLVALLDVTDPRTPQVVAQLDTLAAVPGAPAVVGLTPSTEQEIDAFRWTAVPAFEIQRIDRDVLKRLYRSLPRYFVVEEGRVVAVRDGAPPQGQDLLSSEAS